MRRTAACLKLFYIQGQHAEDYVNTHDHELYTHPRQLKDWYARTERVHASRWIDAEQKRQSVNHHDGLARSGDGAFERELRRRGVPADKYPLPSTAAVRRLREMVGLRRAELQRRAADAMARQLAARRRPAPSEWYDETDGPLNPAFLRTVQPLYEARITDLPREPLVGGALPPQPSAAVPPPPPPPPAPAQDAAAAAAADGAGAAGVHSG